MTNRTTHPSLAEQAMNIMDADGEAAMWEFAKRVSADPGQPPVSAELEDGSVIHLVDDNYTFQDTPLSPPPADRTRRSYMVRKHLPPVFGVQTPVFTAPNRETLCRKVMELLLEQAEEEMENNGLAPKLPAPRELRSAADRVRNALDWNLPMPLPTDPDLTDHLYARMDGLVEKVVDLLSNELRQEIRHKVTSHDCEPARVA